MTDNLHNLDPNLQEEDLLVNTLERVNEINALVDRETVPQGYEVDEEGVWYIQKEKNGTPVREWLSSPLWITGHTRDHKNENHGRILEFQDIDDHKHVWTMPMELLAGESSKILGVLLNMGLRISPKRTYRERLLEYIAQCKPVRRARCVTLCGWFKGAFVLPSQTIGHIQCEKIIYQNPSAIDSINETAGSLDEWREKIGKMAIGNSRLILALSAGFGGPLLDPLNHENIGIHFKGNSSLGKSTALHVANSIWDSVASIRTYRATANGLEGIAAQHNDRILCLDELSQAQAQEAGQVIYMLGNGMGKGRASQQGLARRLATWHLIFLSNGEVGLSQLLGEIGKKTKAGQEVRLIEIPADTGVCGLFENLHGLEGGAFFSTYLKDACARHYGTASRAFLSRLVEKVEESVDFVKTVMDGLTQRYLPKDSSPQVIRVFEHMSLIAGAGELASLFGITGWATGAAADGVMKCFQDWLQARGGLGMQEEQIALEQVKNVFQLHGESRFSPWDRKADDKTRTVNRLGYRKESGEGVEFFVFPQAFRDEVCKGLDYQFVEKVCLKHGILVPDDKGNPTRSERFPGCKKTERCYRFVLETLSDGKE
jgi:putative DNA primase/helicase